MTVGSSQLVFAGLVFTVIAAFGMSRQDGATNTSIDEPAFRLTLPGHWRNKPSSDPKRWIYGSDDQEQLTVSLLGLGSGMSANERTKMFRRLVQSRKHAESDAPGLTAVTITETAFGESGGILAARYGGTEPAVQRRFICLMLGSTTAFMIFYYEAVGLTQSETDARAKLIIDSVVVPK